MESFDQSLKYLLQHQPADFVRFALGDPEIEVIESIPSGLPARARDVDGGYVISRGDTRLVAHIEFQRRHQSAEDLAIDLAEAQIRLFRRERLKVLSLVWDLYGTEDQPVVERRTFDFGASSSRGGSRAVYTRVNLRGLDWKKLLARGAPTLWPLVTLARQGASEAAVHKARDAIEAREDLSAAERADHLAVLWFVAEAERLPVRMMRAYITEERLMESELWLRAVRKGEAKNCAETIVRLLIRWTGTIDPALRDRIRALADLEVLKPWYDEALYLGDAEAAQKLAEKIQRALPA